jgi:hypothetical protein
MTHSKPPSRRVLIDPDHGNGTAEWAIALGLALAALVLGALARRHWQIDRAKALHAEA